MDSFFNTIYYYLRSLYSQELDNYLYSTIPGYLHVGIILTVATFIVCAVFYYLLAPVRNQTRWWFIYAGFNAIINIGVALYYTVTPLINNQIDSIEEWSYLDCFGFCIANVIVSFVFFVFASLLIKWGSTAKYVPFQKF